MIGIETEIGCRSEQGDRCVQSPLLAWFIDAVEAFAPPEGCEVRQRLYADLMALQPEPPATFKDDIVLFVLTQVIAARQLALPKNVGKVRRGGTSHETWYSKERQRIAKLLLQIEDSPIVADFQATVRYYAAEEVTCPHGRNQKTCDALYALQLTLTLLERHPPQGGLHKQTERLRQLEPASAGPPRFVRPTTVARPVRGVVDRSGAGATGARLADGRHGHVPAQHGGQPVASGGCYCGAKL